ncbi:MAG: HDIG domain-containing protein, partial [Candidatus Cloacimonadota bacterium]|nr:HDIG domain-containing protein [Candidatus Cloacimonadota bacterium]
PIYKISTNFTFNSIKNLDYIFSQLDKYSKLSSVDDIKSEMEKVGFSFSKQTIKILKDDITRKLLYDYMTKRVNYILSVGIYNDKDNVKSYKVKRKSSVKIYEKKRLFSITEAIDNLTRKISVQNRKSVEEISNYVLNYNIVVDKQLTDKILYNKISDISLFKGQVLKNEEIIGKNKKVTSQTIAVLNSLKKAYPEMQNGAKSNWNSSFIFQFFLLIILYYSIFFTINNVMQKNLEFKVYLLIYILVFLQFTLLLIQNNISHISILYFPYEFFILLIAISIMPEIAIFLNLILILMISQLIPGSFYAISVHGIISLVAVLWNKKVLRERHSYYLIGFILFFSSAIIVLLSVISHNFTVKTFFNNLLFIFVSNIVTIILLILVTPTVEKTLSITTDERLFRLIDYTNKLLKRLSKQASGTYYHSLNVGGIAENAAEAIGANAILARVAGYYHDIGKLENSEIFSENTLNNTTKHDILLPQESASLIKKHIKHGVILAKKFNLPTEVIDVIKQHHGTTEIKYFLNKAKQANLDIDEEHFRYPGPIPQNKESAL